MDRIRRKLAWDEGGVSEIVGTFLILAITVIIFAGIILWVSSFPGPTATRRADMDASAEPGAWINITHKGGEELKGFKTIVVLLVNGVAETLETQGTRQSAPDLGMPYGLDGDADWNAGEVWKYKNQTINVLTDTVGVIIIDRESNTVVWSKDVIGFAGAHPPLFTAKWLDRRPATVMTRDPLIQGETFGIYAQLLDKDGDLLTGSVFVNFTFLSNGEFQLFDDGTHGDLFAGDNIYSRTDTGLKAHDSWDGELAIFNATDASGKETTTRLVVEVSDIGGGTNITSIGGGTGTWNATLGQIPKGTSGPYGDYGYGIYNQTGRPRSSAPGGNETRVFINYDNTNGDDHVVVVARSTVLKNLFRVNTFILYDSQGAKVPVITREYDSLDPNKNSPAFSQTATSPYHEYTYEFDVTGLMEGVYPVFFQLKDNGGNAPMTVNDLIYITSDFQTADYPRIETFKDPNRDGDLSDIVPSNSFTYLERMYVRLTFKNRDTSTAYITNYTGDVEIGDLYSKFPVKRRPGNEPVSVVGLWDDTWGSPDEECPQQPNACYVLNINLIKKNQDPWTPGTNWYTLRVRYTMDEGVPGDPEVHQNLAIPVEIMTPSSTLDIVTTNEQKGGSKQRGTYWYDNGDYWNEHVVDFDKKAFKKPRALATGDLNGDTMVDIVIGTDEDKVKNIYLYFNENNGESWRRQSINTFQEKEKYKAKALDICDLDGDGDGDIVAGFEDKKDKTDTGVIVFWNDGGWTTQPLEYDLPDEKAEVNVVACGDINQDGRPDIVSGDEKQNINYFENNVAGAFIPPAENGQYPPLHQLAFNEAFNFGDAIEKITENSLRLGQMEGIAYDLDPTNPLADDTLDIVVRGNLKAVWLYTVEITNPVTHTVAFHQKVLDDNLPDEVRSLDIGDFNGDGIIDVAAGVDKDTIYRIRNNGLDPSGTDPDTCNHDCTFKSADVLKLPHTVQNPKKGGLLEIGKIFDIAVGDIDADGDQDIVFIGDKDNEGIGNIFWFRNDGDTDVTEWLEIAVDVEALGKGKEKVFAVELDYIDL